MKYVIVIPDGAADVPLDELDGSTPLEAAATPNLDRLALSGRVGTAATTPPGFGAGSDVCSMSLLGCDPARHHTGRAPLEAAAMGLEMGPGDWVLRINLVSITGVPGDPDAGGVMLDHSGGQIPGAEARALMEDLAAHWSAAAPELARGLRVVHGVEYRGVVIDGAGLGYAGVETVPPHQIPGEPWAEHLPDGGASGAAERLCDLMALSHAFLEDHPINRARVEQGLRAANMAWLWGQGTATALPDFRARFGLRGAMTTAVDLLRGIARLMGWDVLDVPGATGLHETNDYRAQAQAAIDAIDRYDLVCCHVEPPDEAAHKGDWKQKIESIEAIDALVIGPIAQRLMALGDPERDPGSPGWRLLVIPDHFTRCDTRKHDPTPVPFMMAGAWVRSVVRRKMIEREAAMSDLRVDPGHELMEYFLRGGLRSK